MPLQFAGQSHDNEFCCDKFPSWCKSTVTIKNLMQTKPFEDILFRFALVLYVNGYSAGYKYSI